MNYGPFLSFTETNSFGHSLSPSNSNPPFQGTVGFVHKACRTGQYDNLVRFFDRIVIQNTLCPQASLEVEGFGRDLQNDFVVLMKQRFFRQAHKMSEDEIPPKDLVTTKSAP